MQYLKLSVMSRSIDVIYGYNKGGRSFWDDIVSRMRSAGIDVVMEKKGSLQCMFYFPAASGEDALSRVSAVIGELGAEASHFVLVANELGAADLEGLKQRNTDGVTEKAWFAEACRKAQQAPDEKSAVRQPAPPAQTEAKAQPAPPAEETKKTAAPARPAPQPPKEAEAEERTIPPAGTDLAGESVRIEKLRSDLLSVVHGQRHAVDTVVQAIFECDAFTRRNAKHKGPLATFLFTGPSGVGKTFLATQCAEMLGVKDPLVVDMSEYSDNLANNKFNGDHGEPAVVTGYVRSHPDGGVIIFDEIEKAHLNTIYLFLQILDSGHLKDYKLNKEVSFANQIIFITTNAGESLYADPTVIDLSGVPRRVILDALRKDVKPGTKDEPFFPAAIVTRFANGHVVLFNHLEPFSLMSIVQNEIALHVGLFESTYGVKVKYDPDALAALVIYSAGGTADARTLRGLAKNMVVKELQDMMLQLHAADAAGVNGVKTVEITVEPQYSATDVQDLFRRHDDTNVLVFTDAATAARLSPVFKGERINYEFFSEPDAFKRRARGVTDYILLDPTAGAREMDRLPADIEDVRADGVEMFRYLREYYPEIPVYILDPAGRGDAAFSTLLAKGCRGVLAANDVDSVQAQLARLAFGALVNNAAFQLGRSGKLLNYNCSQYKTDSETAQISFDKLSLGYAPASDDAGVVVHPDDTQGVKFSDVIGCKEAKKALSEFCKFVADPRQMLMQGKRIPKGVLLYGPPGTGKTMLAKAMANEAKAAFLPTTATAFFGSLVGESERNVRNLFARARRYAPAIIFIDEVDAVARKRTGAIGSTHNEDTLNQLIAEMDGFTTDERRPVFIMAATNYDIAGDGPRVLDPAFVRRFDRKIYVDLPDTDGRAQFLRESLKRHGVNFGQDHEKVILNVAERSSGLSPADLSNVVDMFLRAVEDGEPTPAALMDALDAFRFGEIKDIDPAMLRQTACHESGHALVNRLLSATPSFLTVVSRGDFGGFMEHSEDERKPYYTYGELMNRVCCALGGRAAEIEVYGREAGVTTGASSDLKSARYYIGLALNEFAMGTKLYTKSTDEECEALLQQQFERTRALISEHRAALDALTDLLLKERSLDKNQLEAFFDEALK